jgi:O-acetyl-ADP-ribose deacetylase (regulator of RNase III)
MADLELWLVHPEEPACDAFRTRFSGLPDVVVWPRSYEQLPPHDCFVTAANSFGMMNAGIDAVLVHVHGQALMDRVQERIGLDFLGEQPVGSCFIIETGTPGYPFVAHSPTMRVPSGIDGTDKVYVATWAALVAIHRHNRGTGPRIRTVAMPAMGTGFGGVSFDEAARQMACAWTNYVRPIDLGSGWDAVIERHRRLSYDGDVRVVPT